MSDKGHLADLGSILNTSRARDDVNFTDIERAIRGDAKSEPQPLEQYGSMMEELERELGMRDDEPSSGMPEREAHASHASHAAHASREPQVPFSSSYDVDDDADEAPSQSSSTSSKPFSSSRQDTDMPRWNDRSQESSEDGQYGHGGNMNTLERDRYERIENVTRNLFPGPEIKGLSFDEDRQEDERIFMIEEIIILQQDLINLGVDIEPYKINDSMTRDQVKRVHSRIKWRASTEQYSVFSGEFIMFGAKLIEKVFNGEREWFGKFRPDLTDWSDTLHSRIRRLRPQTSRFVGKMISQYETGFALDLALEFIPSAFLHSEQRSRQKKERGLTRADVSRANDALRNS